MKKVIVEERYFVRFDAEKTITLSGTVKEFQWSDPRVAIILSVVNGETQPATSIVALISPPAGLLRSGWTSKTLTPRSHDDPPAAGRPKWWPIPDRDAA